MHRPMSAILCAVLLMLSPSAAWSQTTQKKAESPGGSISGRVTFNGQPMPDVTVVLQPNNGNPLQSSVPQAVTNAEGRFRITRVPAGRYSLFPLAPGLVMSGDTPYGRGMDITISDGETLEGLDFELTPGGVITGKVTDADGQPLIDERLTLTQISARGEKRPFFGSSAASFMFSTDDRGEYRLFGLPAGRYTISAGTAAESSPPSMRGSSAYYPRMFYNNVTDEAQATTIEVAPGKEVSRVDIVLRANKTYPVLARAVDAATGEPIPKITLHYGLMKEGSRSFSSTSTTADAKGEAAMQCLPGRYAVSIMTSENPGYYSDPAIFEVTGENTLPVMVKAYRGGSISGVAVIENANTPAMLAKLTGLAMRVVPVPTSPPSSSSLPLGDSYRLQLQPDGSFQVDGVRPGRAMFSLGVVPTSGLSLLRVEREGVEQPNGQITVGADEQVTDVRVIIGYGTGVIRGQIQTTGEAPPEGFNLSVTARPAGQSSGVGSPRFSQVDARGSFILEGLMPGDWEVTASAFFKPPSTPPATPTRPVTVKQTVTVTNGAATPITLVLNLKP